MMYNGYFDDMFGWGWGGGLMAVMMLVFWAAFILFLVWLAREIGGRNHSDEAGRRARSAIDILKERYAKGEINKEEFEGKKKDLES